MKTKILNSYGREYVRYLLNGIDRSHCYPPILKYIEAVEIELSGSWEISPEDINKLRQIFYRTNGNTPPKQEECDPFIELV